jgi:hypothetical protein
MGQSERDEFPHLAAWYQNIASQPTLKKLFKVNLIETRKEYDEAEIKAKAAKEAEKAAKKAEKEAKFAAKKAASAKAKPAAAADKTEKKPVAKVFFKCTKQLQNFTLLIFFYCRKILGHLYFLHIWNYRRHGITFNFHCYMSPYGSFL